MAPTLVEAAAFEYADGTVLAAHAHPRAQLVYAVSGTMTVFTEAGVWVVPPQRAVWVPAESRHEIRMSGTVAMRTLYLGRGTPHDSADRCFVVSVRPLLRELILECVRLGGRHERRRSALEGLLLDELREASVAPLYLPEPHDDRLVRITRALRADPGDARSLDEWARVVGAGTRTLARLFLAETGLSFRAWRQQARLLGSLELLAQGVPVARVSSELGYSSTSAFIHMFRRALGVTPSRYFTATTTSALAPAKLAASRH